MDQLPPRLDVQEGVVAFGSTRRDSGVLASTFSSAWPVEQAVPFDELLRKIDEAECRLEAKPGGYH